MILDARHTAVAVDVVVTDHGHWWLAGSAPEDRRGRGLELIHGLAAEADVRTRPEGTTVRLHQPCPCGGGAPGP